jgi:hypothetical protein
MACIPPPVRSSASLFASTSPPVPAHGSGAVGTSARPTRSRDRYDLRPVRGRNLTSQPLIDINIALASGMLVFSDTIGRLEAKEKRRFVTWLSRDDTSFSLRIAAETSPSRRRIRRQAARNHNRWQ